MPFCRSHQVRPRTVAEISAIETLLRSLELKAAALLPNVQRGSKKLKAIRLLGKSLVLGDGNIAAQGLFCQQHDCGIYGACQGHRSEDS